MESDFKYEIKLSNETLKYLKKASKKDKKSRNNSKAIEEIQNNI
jgi:hypothetical protein